MKAKKALPWLGLSTLIIVLDQVTKYLVVSDFFLRQPFRIFPFLNITLNFNTGAAFSFLGAQSGWQVYFFAVLSFIIAMFLIFWLSRVRRSDYGMAVGLSLIIGGALSNFIDRVRLGYVIDFIDFHLKGWHYATFNVADSAICVGVIFLIVRMLFSTSS